MAFRLRSAEKKFMATYDEYSSRRELLDLTADEALRDDNIELATSLIEQLQAERAEHPNHALHYDYTANNATFKQIRRYGESPFQNPPRILYLPVAAADLLLSGTGQQWAAKWSSCFIDMVATLGEYETEITTTPPWHAKFSWAAHEQLVTAQVGSINLFARHICLLAEVAAPEQFYTTD